DALKYIGMWIILVAESVIEKNLSEMKASKLLSKLLVRTALKMGKFELNKLINERTHIVTLDKASNMGDELEREVLFSHFEIQQNIGQLENPNSYESYFDALPKIICSFFHAFITVLQQQKQNVINKKRESSFTDDLLIMYENTLNTMLEICANEFDMKDVHLKIIEQVHTG
ncbi:19509_t:CDS:2, partial [Funneliformis geosporum]